MTMLVEVMHLMDRMMKSAVSKVKLDALEGQLSGYVETQPELDRNCWWSSCGHYLAVHCCFQDFQPSHLFLKSIMS